MASLVCSQCGSTDIETDSQRGDAVCIQCGTVLEENQIVNEVTFAQDAGGGSSVVGQFVAATPGVGSSGLGFKESRELAFNNGQRHISQLAAALRLAEHHQEAAQRLFMLAVQHNFIQGRRTQHVIAACLYTVCRKEKTPHLLIDYSDVLQENVYMLGSCFLKFTRLLSLTLPIIDPSLYIHRFASKLEFGDKTHLVSMSALRLVQRMKRDWIQTGRRPSGICGAALLIAARVHGFRRTQREVVRVVRICDVTLRRRLTEFADTPMGSLTARQLETSDIEAFPAADPPSYTRNRLLEAEQLAALTETPEHRARANYASEIRALKVAEIRARLYTLGVEPTGKKEQLVQKLLLAAPYQHTEEASDPADAAEDAHAPSALMPPPPVDPVEAEMHSEMSRVLQDPAILALDHAAASDPGAAAAVTIGASAPASTTEQTEPAPAPNVPLPQDASEAANATGGDVDGMDGAAPQGAAGGSLGEGSMPPFWTSSAFFRADLLPSRDEQASLETEEQQRRLMAELNDDLEALDDEVDGYLITDAEEVQMKTRVWEEMNRDYLDAQAEKAAARQEAMRAAAERGETIDPNDVGGRKRGPSMSKRQRREAQEARAPGSAAEAAAAELRRNKLSSRINYDVVHVLSQTLDEDAEHMPDGPGPVGSLSLGSHAAGGGGGGHLPPSSPVSHFSYRQDFSETLSVHSAASDAEPFY